MQRVEFKNSCKIKLKKRIQKSNNALTFGASTTNLVSDVCRHKIRDYYM